MTLKQIHKEIKRLDPGLDYTDDIFETATILLAGIVVGADAKKIAKFTELPIAVATL